ncbi:MAG: acetyl-CoA carboxylase biotin carboxyl carrier protein subunit, partial [Pseudomonadota bacterium]
GAYPRAGWSSAVPLAYFFRLESGEHQQQIKVMESNEGCLDIEVGTDAFKFELDLAAETLTENGVVDHLSFRFEYDTRLYLDTDNSHCIFEDISYAPAVAEVGGSELEVKAAMDGAIVDVKVKVGDLVERGQIVAILEAMKMAHQLKAGCDGVVEEINVAVGQQVKTRQTLVKIKAPDA